LIYDINRVIHFRAGAIEANLKKWTSMDQPQDAAGMATLPGESHVVMHEPGVYYNNNVGYIPERTNNNPCSTSDVDMAKVQVCYMSWVVHHQYI